MACGSVMVLGADTVTETTTDNSSSTEGGRGTHQSSYGGGGGGEVPYSYYEGRAQRLLQVGSGSGIAGGSGAGLGGASGSGHGPRGRLRVSVSRGHALGPILVCLCGCQLWPWLQLRAWCRRRGSWRVWRGLCVGVGLQHQRAQRV
eukprot:460959-Rhodomonas_salina.1